MLRKKAAVAMGVHVTEISRPRPAFRVAIAGRIAGERAYRSPPVHFPSHHTAGEAWETTPSAASALGASEVVGLRSEDDGAWSPAGFASQIDYRSKALLELIASPAAICDAAGVVLRSNLLMDATLRSQDALFLHQGALKCRVGIESTILSRTIQSLASGSSADGELMKSQILRIGRMVSSQPLIVALSPLAGGLSTSTSEVLVRIVATTHRPELNVDSLCEVFELTRSEASLCVALARCGSLKEAAATCGITTGSGRQYMKRIFAKTNTSSQVALLSLLLHYPLL